MRINNMEKVYANSDYSSQILSQMLELWRGNKYCDAVLNLQDERFKLHKLVLMAACPNILRCLAHTEENNVFEFYLPEDSEKSVVMLVVNYLYIGSIQLNMTNVYGIEKLAKQLRLSTLSQFCHDFISLLESETFSQRLLQPGIHQENIPKQESIEVEKVVDPKAVDALNNSANATLTEINNGASSLPESTDGFGQVSCLPQSTDGFGQLPLSSELIKTELDAFISPTLEETISKNQEKTITIEPLNNILQFSKSDNSMTTALAASSACKSYDSATLDIHLGSDRLQSDPVSHRTGSNGMLNPQLNSSQVSTSTRFTPELSMVACKPSTSQSHGGERDNIDLIMTAEDEDFEDSDDEWVPKGDESSESDFYPESTLDRSTRTKRKMSTKRPKAKRSKNDAPLTAKKKKVRGDKVHEIICGKHSISLQTHKVVIVRSDDDLRKAVNKIDQETVEEDNRCISKQKEQVSTSTDDTIQDNITKILDLLRVINGQKLEEILRLLHNLNTCRAFNSNLMEGIVQAIKATDTECKLASLVQPENNTVQEENTRDSPAEQIQYQPSQPPSTSALPECPPYHRSASTSALPECPPYHHSSSTSALPECLPSHHFPSTSVLPAPTVEIKATKPWQVMESISSSPEPVVAPRHKRPVNLKCNKGALLEISSHDDITCHVPADTEIRIKGHMLREAQLNAISLGNFAWWIAQKIFREDEMTGRNYYGNKGKLPLSPRRTHAIEHAVIDMCGPHVDNIREAANAINTGIRNRAHRKADKIVKRTLPLV